MMIEQPMPGSTLTRAEIARRVAALEAEREAAATRREAPRRSGGTPGHYPSTATRRDLSEARRKVMAKKTLNAGASELARERIARGLTERQAAAKCGVGRSTFQAASRGDAVSATSAAKILRVFPAVHVEVRP